MNDLELLLKKLQTISLDIKKVVKQSKFDKYDDLSGLDIDYKDSEQSMLRDELCCVMSKLTEAERVIEYLSKPIENEGYLFKREDGRYGLDNGQYFTCGSPIEAYIYDDFDERYKWVKTRIEGDRGEYFLWGYKEVPLQGLRVRTR